MRFAVFSVAGIGILLVIIITVMGLQRPTVITITPSLTGQPERCLTCHNGIEAISPSHSIAQFGCVSCHGGDALAVDEATAHTGLIVNPASLDNAQKYCGNCHEAQVILVQRDIMNTYAGAISLIRQAYGLQPDNTAQYAAQAVGDLQTFHPAPDDPLSVHEFANNCQSCHISSDPQHAAYFYRSTGCATCHVLYADDGLYKGGDPTISKTEPGHPETHTFTTSIPYTQCDHCHNRGNYDLRTMTFDPRTDLPTDPDAQIMDRVRAYYQPISQYTHCEVDLDCIDCHTQNEIMGDGVIYNNEASDQYIQCKTCHGTLDGPPLSEVVASPDDMAMTLANLNALVPLAVGDTIMVTDRAEPLYNIRLVNGQWILTGKVTGKSYVVPLVQGSKCQQNPNNQSSASCHQCHNINEGEPP